jgi:cysteinyl-tRNA synthetase
MSLKYLGMGFDIHGGGDELIFPHHENEIAQSEAYTGREPFARYWLHNAMVMVGEEKMSKSLHNYVTVSDALRRFPPEVVRYALVSVHYRKPIHFEAERFEEARKPVERIRAALRAADTVISGAGGGGGGGPRSDALRKAAAAASAAYEAAMDDDLNTSGALAAIFDLVTELNRETDLVVKATAEPGALFPGVVDARAALLRMLGILGLNVTTAREDEHVHARVRELAAKLRSEIPGIFPVQPDTTSLLFDDLSLEDVVSFLLSGREQARRRKDFKTADQIRARLSEAGVLVEDLPTGPRWRIAGPNGRSH